VAAAEVLGVTQPATSITVQELLRLGYVHQVTELEGRIAESVGPQRFVTGQEVLAAAMQVLGMADDVRRRSVPPPPESL
jgi:hypothetical protein